MALVLKDRVRETTTTTGTGSITLAGAVTGFQPFSIIGDGNYTYYCIVDRATGAWETGEGAWSSSGNTLSRYAYQSSNNNALVNFGAGSKDVFLSYLADSQYEGNLQYSQITNALGFTPYSATNPENFLPRRADVNAAVLDGHAVRDLVPPVGTVGSFPGTYIARSAEVWTERATLGDGSNSFGRGSAYGNGVYVAVGALTQIYRSTDGLSWSAAAAAPTNGVGYVTFGNGIFMAVGGWPVSFNLITSTDGITWTSRSGATGHNAGASRVAYGNGLWIYAGYQIMGVSTNNGVSWQAITPPVTNGGCTGLAYLNGMWLIGYAGSRLYTSTDGYNWTFRSSSLGGAPIEFAYGNGRFVAGCTSGYVASSTDGLTWTSVYLGDFGDYNGCVFAKGRFFLGNWGLCPIRSSFDGVTWTASSQNFNISYSNLLYVERDDLFVVANAKVWTAPSAYPGEKWLPCDGNTYTKAAYPLLARRLGINKSDVTDWVSRTSGLVTRYYRAIHFVQQLNLWVVAGGWVAFGETVFLATSSDAISWTQRTPNTTQEIKAIASGNGVIVYVGTNGAYGYSYDGVTWTGATLSGQFQDITFGAGLFVAVRDANIVSSPDGITWTQRANHGAATFYAVTYANGLFIAVGNTNTVYVSSNGISWYSRNISGDIGSVACTSVTYAFGYYWLVATSGKCARSEDGFNWTVVDVGAGTNQLNYIIHADGLLVIAALNDALYISRDGKTWYTRVSPFSGSSALRLAYGRGLIAAISSGSDNRVRTSSGLDYNQTTHFAVPSLGGNFSGPIGAPPYIRAIV